MFPGEESRAGTMLEAKIVKTGRGPEIAGTRITVYDVIEYYKTGWHRDMIASLLSLSSPRSRPRSGISRSTTTR